MVANAGLEAEADRHGELAAQGLPASARGTAARGAAAADGAIQMQGPPEPPAGQVAQQHTFTVPTIPDLNHTPDAVTRNHTINQTYHQIDIALTGYLGEPLVANWFTFGQHASREAGTQIRNLQMGLAILRDSQTILIGLSFGVNPITAVQTAIIATRTFQRVLDLMAQDHMIQQVMQLAFSKAGITTAELQELVTDAALAAAFLANPVVGSYFLARFVARVSDMVAKLIVAIPAIIEAVERIYENMKRGNKQIYENVAPAARMFLQSSAGRAERRPRRAGVRRRHQWLPRGGVRRIWRGAPAR